jgi:hypothetical protein
MSKQMPLETIIAYWERLYEANWIMDLTSKTMVEETINRLKEMQGKLPPVS